MAGVVLFEIENSLIREWKDVSAYFFEAIRNSYGLSIDEISLADYHGKTVQETVTEILGEKAGLSAEEIKAKMELFLNELPYAHYNVAGHDKAILNDGARQLIDALKRKNFVMGAATGQLERIIRNMFDRALLRYDDYFAFGVYGDSGMHMQQILDKAMAVSRDRADSPTVSFVSSVNGHLLYAKKIGMNAVGVNVGEKSKPELSGAGIYVAKGLRDCERFIR